MSRWGWPRWRVRALLACALGLGAPSSYGITFAPKCVFVERLPKEMRDAFSYAANDIPGGPLAPSYANEPIDVPIRWRELGWPGPYAQTQVSIFRDFASESPVYRPDTCFRGALAN